MMRVLVIEPAGGLWGSERALLDLIESMPQLEVAVCCPPGTPLQAELRSRRIKVLPYFVANLHQKSRLQRLQAAAGVLRACLSFRPHVMHINQSGAYRVTLPAASILGLPVICHVRLFEDVAYLGRQNPDPDRLKGVIAISGAIENEIRSFAGLEAIPVHQIYDAYALAPSPAQTTKRERYRIACVGRVTPIKGQELLLGALIHGEPLPEGAECLIVGDGEDNFVSQLKEMTPTTGPMRIEWLGFIKDIAPLLRTCRVLACPSHREPLGRVIFEAWDAGVVPVVYGGSGGSAEIVAAAEGGVIYEEQTPGCLARALATALSLEDGEARCLVENGRAWMANHCQPQSYGRAIASVLSAT